MKRIPILLLVAAATGFSQTPTKADACAPPPGAVPPSLPAKLLTGQGTIHFPITTRSAEAQAFFNQGVAQMHSFWAREAERSFLQAAALDPAAAMPQWGIAMVASGDYRPGFQLDLVNGRQAKPRPRTSKPTGGEARAVAAAQKARELSANATELEKLYIAAAVARRDLSQPDPNVGYVEALRTLLAKFPKEVEARSYLALQIMSGFELPVKTPRAGSMEAAQLLRELLKDAPEHPGVHHYVIHGFEGSTFARDAWPSCDRYGKLANNIPHGLHMPGHIYAQTGRWQDAVQSFAAAAENEVYWMKADSLAGNGHHGHNVHFLAASYSFQGQYDKALEAARSLLEYKENPREAAQVDNFRTAWRQGWFSVLRTLVQGEKWDAILDGKSLPEYDKPRERAWRHWALGLAHLGKGNRREAGRELKRMDAALKEFRVKVKQDPPAPLSVARDELKGQLARKVDTRLLLLDRAASRERALRYNEPPNYPRPIAEVIGQLALRHNKPQVAERAFRQALEQYPESALARTGLRAAVSRQNRPADSGF
jgi:tetratricopeptide (TPR) repeat protein